MKALLLMVVCALGSFACSSRCEDLRAREVAGRFTWEPESYQSKLGPSGAEMVSAELLAEAGKVVFTYELADGSRFRATYRVAAKHEMD